MAGNSNHGDFERRTFLKATGAAGAAAALSGITAATPGREPGPKPNQLLVGVQGRFSMDEAKAQLEAEVQGIASSGGGGMEIAHENPDLQYMAVEIPDVSDEMREQFVEMFERMDFAKYAEWDQTYHALSTPNDPRFSDQYAPQQVKAPTAWETESGSGATVAVVDQGVKYDEPDLQAQFGSNKGKDFVDGDGDPIPDSNANEYHGTHVAGITAATRNNNEGVAGISDATLLSGRALSEQGSGSTADIADAVQWAADQGADIVNMSLGGGGYTDTMKNAVSYAVDNGCLPICASGNDGSGTVSYPAKYDECVAVGAVNESEELASFSNYGTDQDVVAPGVDILSTWTERGTEYNRISGTSMACPAASGVAALGISANPGWSPTELKSQLKSTADDIGLSENEQGSGRVNAAAIVGDGGNQPPSASIDASSTSITVGQTVDFDGSGSSDPDGSISSYSWDLNGDGAEDASGATASKTYNSAGTYEVSLTVTDDKGATGTASVSISVGSGSNSPPVADFSASSTSISVGDTVDFDASASSDSDGSISSYEWDLDGNDTIDANGVTASKTYNSAGSYEVTLIVTDDDGATSRASATISVEDTGGTCGATSETVSGSGTLYGYYDDAAFAYTTQLDDPCQISFSLSGAAFTDFDLYVTADGRTPTTMDYDKRSITPDSSETVVFDDVSAGQEFGILVDSYDGSGDFTITVEEVGR